MVTSVKIGKYSWQFILGRKEARLFVDGMFMDKWMLDFTIQSEMQFEKYAKSIIEKWEEIA
jgi:hypothetical protein